MLVLPCSVPKVTSNPPRGAKGRMGWWCNRLWFIHATRACLLFASRRFHAAFTLRQTLKWHFVFSLLSLCEVYTHFELVQPEIKSNYESNLSHYRHTFRCQAHLLCKKVVHPALETLHATAVSMRCSSRKFLLLTNYMLLVSRYLYACCKCKECFFLSVGTF